MGRVDRYGFAVPQLNGELDGLLRSWYPGFRSAPAEADAAADRSLGRHAPQRGVFRSPAGAPHPAPVGGAGAGPPHFFRHSSRGLLARYRLVTLTGPGGTGKSRLAQQAAAEALVPTDGRMGIADGEWLVELAARAHRVKTSPVR